MLCLSGFDRTIFSLGAPGKWEIIAHEMHLIKHFIQPLLKNL